MLHDPNIHYLDNAATTMVNPEVIETITKAMAEPLGQPLQPVHPRRPQ